MTTTVTPYMEIAIAACTPDGPEEKKFLVALTTGPGRYVVIGIVDRAEEVDSVTAKARREAEEKGVDFQLLVFGVQVFRKFGLELTNPATGERIRIGDADSGTRPVGETLQ